MSGTSRTAPGSRQRSRLLVSVRSAVEAEAALAGGADLIDVKEPDHGPLGRATDAVIAEVVRGVAGRTPVSAALGELAAADAHLPLLVRADLQFAKWGLAGCQPGRDWCAQLRAQSSLLAQAGSSTRLVVVAYADWALAQAPPVVEVVEFACRQPGGVLLIDTFTKRPGVNLLDWLSCAELLAICQQCWTAQVRVALAGSLGQRELIDLREIRPDWFAVRGAACGDGRLSAVCTDRVRELVRLLNS